MVIPLFYIKLETKRGYSSMLDIYKRISPQLKETLYTCPSGQAGETR